MSQRGHAVVFGGSGFIGTHLCRSLIARGWEVTVADLVAPGKAGTPPDVRYVPCDVREPIPDMLASETTVVFNLAAVHTTPGHQDHEYYDTNVAGAINVTRWAAARGVSDLLFTSSISVYGPNESARSETSELDPDSSYGRSKLLAENIHRDWAATGGGRRLVVVRPAVIFGQGENGNFTRLAGALAAGRFAYPGRRDTVKGCGYVKDLVAAMLYLRDNGRPVEIANFCYPDPYTIQQICEAFVEVAGYRQPRQVPELAIQTAIRVLSVLPTPDGRAYNPERIRKLTRSTWIRPDRLQELGFQWDTDLRSALLDWLGVDGVFR